jgi:putative PEP-CTERM system histidine kinase
MSLGFLLALCSGSLAAVLAVATALKAKARLPQWAFAGGMAILAAEAFFAAMASTVNDPIAMLDWERLAFSANWLLPGPWLLFSLTYARGNYQEQLHKWTFPLAAVFVLPLILVLGFSSELVFMERDAEGAWTLRVGTLGLGLSVLFLLSCVLAVMHLETTYRAAVGTMRWRIKFTVLGLGVLFAVRAYTTTQLLLFRSVRPNLQELNSGVLLVACLLVLRSMFRAGHFEVNVYPSQAVLHNSLTALLAGAYLIIVGLLAKVVAFLGGDSAFERKAFVVLAAVVLLAVVLLSDRVRLHTRRFISRHFQRPLYDYRTVWRTFTNATARRVDQIDLCKTVVTLVSEIFQALSVSIWLVDDRKERLTFAASTSLNASDADQLTLEPADAAEVIAALSQHPEPIDIDASKETWASALRRSHPYEFQKGGNRICLPLMAAGELLGILVLGDRVGGIQFSIQDYDLLKSASDQAAANLLNIQFSQRLSQAKQLEAFQAMSAFFVHDLKNTASTLSLMLQNLPVHYQDPRFREDALRGISKTVDHINEVISRLTVLRHDLDLKTVECDLNDVVAESLKGQGDFKGVEVVQDFQTIPKVRIDPAQIQKVVTNMVLNAREALSNGGTIRLATSRRDGWAVLGVSDNGCGMSPEFLSRSLFRPFSTTKKKGIGIGMFHCKMIVEAHHGRIEVQSEFGKGTTFRVLLPIKNN